MSDTTTSVAAPTAPDTSTSDSWDDPVVDSQEADSTPEVKDSKPEPKEEGPAKKAKRWLEAKVNGKVEKVDEETLLRDYQKYKASEQKFQEAAKIKQSMEQFMKALKEDPEAVLSNSKLPIDRKKLAEKWLYEQIQQELDPPDPRDQKVKEYEEELKKYKQKEEEEVKTKEEQEYEQAVSKRKNELGNLFSEAMKASALSKHPETSAATLREMALYYRACKEAGETPDAQELAAHVEKKYYKGLYELANTLEGDDLVQFLGPQIIKKLRAYDLGQLTKGKQEFTQSGQQQEDDWSTVTKGKTKGKTISPADMRDQIRQQFSKK